MGSDPGFRWGQTPCWDLCETGGMSTDFELPRGCTGFGVDSPAAVVEARRQSFVRWARAVAEAHGSPLAEITATELRPSFDTIRLDRLDLWLLHNRFVPVVGVLGVGPEPGPSWAVAGQFVDLDIPAYAQGWGPDVVDHKVLNAPLGAASLDTLALGAREQADRYKPATTAHILFNYWS